MSDGVNKTYICSLLEKRKELLQNEVKRLTLDKGSPLAIIEKHIREMELIDEQRKELSK